MPNGEHIPNKEGKNLTGTARYASAATHLGFEQSRRDDLECAGYILLYLLKGDLPWMGLNARNKEEKYRMIKDTKVNTPLELMCEGYPDQFVTYLQYCRRLGFSEQPNYQYLKRLFRDLSSRCQFKMDFILDWTVQKYVSLEDNSRLIQTNYVDRKLTENSSKARNRSSLQTDFK